MNLVATSQLHLRWIIIDEVAVSVSSIHRGWGGETPNFNQNEKQYVQNNWIFRLKVSQNQILASLEQDFIYRKIGF